jgi:hypothetical protein
MRVSSTYAGVPLDTAPPAPTRSVWRAELNRQLRALDDHIRLVQHGISIDVAQSALAELAAYDRKWVALCRERGDRDDMSRLCGRLMSLRRMLQHVVLDPRARR